MSNYQNLLDQVATYQKKIGSHKTYLYEVYTSEHKTNAFLVVLADSDTEAKHIASILEPRAIWMRVDHWGYGPRIDLKF